MSAEEKILQGILDDAKKQADEILSAAEAECREIEEKAAVDAKAYSATTVSAALFKAKSIKENGASAAELTVRDAKLAKRHGEIEKTLQLAEERISALPDDKYFALLTALAKANAKDEEAELLLSAADLKRSLSVFEGQLAAAGVKAKIRTAPADISAGLVLKYGDIEYNLTVAAVINDKREVLEDKINAILFAE